MMMPSNYHLLLLAGCAAGLFSGFVGLTCLLMIILRHSNWYQFAPEFLKKSPIRLIFMVNGFLLVAMIAGIFFVMIYSLLGIFGLLTMLLILIIFSTISLYYFTGIFNPVVFLSLFLLYGVYGLLIPLLIDLSSNS
ncbi:MAG: hypothetical protein CL792_01935 [Chloroflexi bacterium]|nr:hypothetical protein [Chloroflexota bacterium]|tara:strand:+ start:2851 stop:3258 length:408 start_codon:yes stop_codon:yes gene_type:complete